MNSIEPNATIKPVQPKPKFIPEKSKLKLVNKFFIMYIASDNVFALKNIQPKHTKAKVMPTFISLCVVGNLISPMKAVNLLLIFLVTIEIIK